MNWNYLAGYFDGEGCIVLGIPHEKRDEKKTGSDVDGWGIMPQFKIQSYDYEVLTIIKDFLIKNDFNVSIFWRNKRRVMANQNKAVMVMGVAGWKSTKRIFKILSKYSISKKLQMDLFLELCKFKEKNLKRKWSKKNFILAMEIVDKINSLKSGKRGKYNADYFKKLWSL